MIRRRCGVIIFSAVLLLVSIPAAAEDSSSLNRKGMDELRANHPDKAVEFFSKAISIDPGQKHYHNNLAAAYMRLNDYSKAEEQLKLSLLIDGNFATALANMSVTLFHLGRYKESYDYYRLAKKADSEYTEKRFNKKRVLSAVKKTSDEKPDDAELKRIMEYMESEDGE